MSEGFDWSGWVRDSTGFWQRVAQGRSITECAHRLEQVVSTWESQPANSDLCLTTGGVPDVPYPSRP
jgi:hypothetical protein